MMRRMKSGVDFRNRVERVPVVIYHSTAVKNYVSQTFPVTDGAVILTAQGELSYAPNGAFLRR